MMVIKYSNYRERDVSKRINQGLPQESCYLDTAALATLRPHDVAAYRRATGWQQEAEFEGKSSLWIYRIDGGEEVDVLVPMRRDLSDFALRVSENAEDARDCRERSASALGLAHRGPSAS